MSIQTLSDRLPEYAKDLKLSLGTLAGETVLDDAAEGGTFIASAIAQRATPVVIEAVVGRVRRRASTRARSPRRRPRPRSWR